MTILAQVAASHSLAVDETLSLTKYREISANMVQFITATHTSEANDKLTLTSTPPKAQPGNAGTTKTLLNRQRQVVINAGTVDERVAPIVVRLEVSVPVGSHPTDLDNLLHDIQFFTAMNITDNNKLFANAIMPQ